MKLINTCLLPAFMALPILFSGHVLSDDTPSRKVTAAMDGRMQKQITSATGNINGLVKDQNGKPLEGVTVKVISSSDAVLTNSNGTYQLTGLAAPQKYELRISMISYKTRTIFVNTSPDKTVRAQDVTLKDEGINATIIKQLLSLHNKQKYSQFSELLTDVLRDCSETDVQDCRRLREVKKLFDANPQHSSIRTILQEVLGRKSR